MLDIRRGGGGIIWSMTSTTNFNQPQHKFNKQNPLPRRLAANPRPHKPGFTIIEVVLVLAIAGLIFLMVFITLPALQRNQRDTQRKNDMSKLKSAIESYKANNKGQIPTTTEMRPVGANFSELDFGKNYLKADTEGFNDPSGGEYKARWATVAVDYRYADQYRVEFPNQIFILHHHQRNGTSSSSHTIKTENSNNYAILYPLEGGGVYCLDG